ncbi:hypothetical protein G5714_015244 [Onychostoma macrolepis]|uniref:Uncharacterized protein n=1 Tax=Onychostoma macrolepis TaxID=369639 RepID=A0A7J6CAC9_9TELE|nr:hypothetical protein G5714_015244 [Onychostoma macrolepis]
MRTQRADHCPRPSARTGPTTKEWSEAESGSPSLYVSWGANRQTGLSVVCMIFGPYVNTPNDLRPLRSEPNRTETITGGGLSKVCFQLMIPEGCGVCFLHCSFQLLYHTEISYHSS